MLPASCASSTGPKINATIRAGTRIVCVSTITSVKVGNNRNLDRPIATSSKDVSTILRATGGYAPGILKAHVGFRNRGLMISEQAVRDALHTVRDPEIGKPIDDIGMLGSLEIDGDVVRVEVLLTVAGCPLKAE